VARLTKIYTRSGDDGTTSLANGNRIRKDSARINALGDIDELNSILGLLRTHTVDDDEIDTALYVIQNRLFNIGGELAIPDQKTTEEKWVTTLETWLDKYNEDLPKLEEFILPGGNIPAANCHIARSVCRRTERSMLELSESEFVNPLTLKYLNRLSDFLFVIARILARKNNGKEVLWDRSM
tara:strand:- start:12206 stop:12751 length:546 start_codon:yes stop_codon:yes gene_type:complete